MTRDTTLDHLPPTRAGADPTRTRIRLLAVALALAAAVSAVNILGRPVLAVDTTSFEHVAPARDAVWRFALVGATSTGVAFTAAGLAGCRLVTGRGARLATVSALLTALGGLGFAMGFFAMGATTWYATSAAAGDSAAALVDHIGAESLHAFGPQIAGFLMFVLGYLLLAVALWRSRAVPRWLPVGIAATFVLGQLAGTGIAFDVVNAPFMGTMVALAWYVWRSVGDPADVAPV